MIEVTGLTRKFGAKAALSGVSFTVGAGEIFAYLGPNGAGKTTTIRILTSLTRRDGGTVRLNSFDIETHPLECKSQFGIVPQHTNLDSDLSVEENLLIHGLLHHMERQEITQRTGELLDYMEMSDRRQSLVKNLSGGLKRRLLIARALMHTPRILFMDEPTVGLDPAIRRSLWGFIKRIKNDGATIFLTTHYIEEAEFLADRVAFLDAGKIVAEDTSANLMAAIGQWAVDYLDDNRLQTAFFNSREKAGDYVLNRANGCTVRRVNLEDAFISMTGRKIS
ncbi:MAG: ABC transporter-like [Desulfobulbaceae bacterium]|jgi:ABC-2 type transport system ATP-binding protein|nr:MAG: ABC transporter-like [Desulfobulbaceae bacterium]